MQANFSVETDYNHQAILSAPLVFNHKSWRKTLLLIEKELQQSYQGISLCGPFGFELCWNSTNAPIKIKKTYIYTSNPTNLNADALANVIENIALKQLEKHYHEISDDIVITIKNQLVSIKEPMLEHCNPTSKLLDIQVRETKKPILEDYAEYVMLAYQSIQSKSGEAQNYEYSPLCRSRMFQLSTMLYNLYAPFLPEVIVKQMQGMCEAFKQYINNSLDAFLSELNKTSVEITANEHTLINRYVTPLCQTIEDIIAKSVLNTDSTISVSVEPYHIKADNLVATMSKNLYDQLLRKTIDTYHGFII